MNWIPSRGLLGFVQKVVFFCCKQSTTSGGDSANLYHIGSMDANLIAYFQRQLCYNHGNYRTTSFVFSAIMFMPKQHRVSIYEYLFKEGVMVAKKDFNAPKHPELDTIPNLHVIKTMQSLQSKGLVTEQFAWRHYYW